VNGIAPEPLEGFQPKLTQILLTLWPRADEVFKVRGSMVKITETFSDRGGPIDGLAKRRGL